MAGVYAGTVNGGGITYHWGVVVQGRCPPKCSAEMSPVYSGIVSDVDAGKVTAALYSRGGVPQRRRPFDTSLHTRRLRTGTPNTTSAEER